MLSLLQDWMVEGTRGPAPVDWPASGLVDVLSDLDGVPADGLASMAGCPIQQAFIGAASVTRVFGNGAVNPNLHVQGSLDAFVSGAQPSSGSKRTREEDALILVDDIHESATQRLSPVSPSNLSAFKALEND
jgi:hypothetical protein